MDADQALEVRRACAARVLGRKRQPVERRLGGQNFGRTDLIVSEVQGSEFTEPQDLGQWLDDRIAATPWCGPHCGVLYAVAEAARDSEGAALAELGGAKRLSRWDQHHCLVMLLSWRDAAGALPAARSLMSAIVSEWDRRRLPDGRPDAQVEPELPDLPEPPGPKVLDYPTPLGIPAGRLAWS